MNYRLFSKNKVFLMGCAMLLVAVFHSPFIFSNNILMYIKNKLYIGVDIFLFVSGIGIYYSYTKNNNKKQFYKKRILKIIPVALFVSILFGFIFYGIKYYTEEDFWASITFTNFLLKIGKFPIWYWYIPSILILYLVSPFIIDYYNKYDNKKTIYISIFIIVLFLLLFSLIPSLMNLQIFISRIPIYLIGLKFGELSYQNKYMPKSHIIFYLENALLSIGALYFFDKHPIVLTGILGNVLLIFPTIMFSIIISLILNKIKKYKFPIINFIGTITLEIYLLHERVIVLLNYIIISKLNIKINYLLFSLIAFLITVLLAYLLSKLMSYLLHKEKKA